MQISAIVRSRLFWGVVTGLAVGAGTQGLILTAMARSNQPPALSFTPPIGRPADLLVDEAGKHSPRRLADIGAGSCRLIVVYSPVCGASLAAARRWHQDIVASADTAALPPGWIVAWLSVADSTASASFLPDGFSLRRLYATDANSVLSRLGIRAFPAHLVVDSDGTILGGGVGAPLYRKPAYGKDCRISAQEVAPNAQ